MINKLKLLWWRFWLSDIEEEIAELKHFIDYSKDHETEFNAIHGAKCDLASLRQERLSIIAKIAGVEG